MSVGLAGETSTVRAVLADRTAHDRDRERRLVKAANIVAVRDVSPYQAIVAPNPSP
jgi:hypothetical protein